MLSAALALHQNGQLDEARRRYEQLLVEQPEHPEALHLLGALHLQQGNAEQAVELIGRAIALQPDIPLYYGNLANALHQQGDDEAALLRLDVAVGRFPKEAEIHYNRGIVLASLKRTEAAAESFLEATRLAPQHAAAWYNLGNAYLQLEAYRQAAEAYVQATQLRPKYVKAWYNLGKARRELGEDEAAVDAYGRAIALDPGYAKAYYNRANALQSLRRYLEAVADYDRCIALQPNDDVALVNKGNALLSQRQFESAVDAYDQAISVKPDVAAYHNNRGNAFLGMRQTRRALDAYGRAIAVDPLEKDAHFNRAICHLLVGELEAGFEEYEWRWQTEDLAAAAPRFEQPAWRGEVPLAGKRILLYCEQGLGDTIQFVRYAMRVSDLGAHVILVVQPPLLNLLRGLDGRGELIANGSPLPPFDYHCPLLSLPHALGTSLATVPASERYIAVDAKLARLWQARLGQRQRPRIGLAWSGRPEHKNDENRSLRLEQLLAALPEGPDYICLQKELRDCDRATLAGRPDIRFFGDELRDFADTAALCEQLDLVVSVDTSVAHMAAAIGKPTWILLPFVPDWRWMLDRDDSPWYPSVKLFRQAAPGDWNGMFAKLRQQLLARFGSQVKPSAPTASTAPAQSTTPFGSESFATEQGRLPVLMNWQAGSNFGWGVAGFNIFQHWAADSRLQPLMAYRIEAAQLKGLDVLRQMAISRAVDFSNRFVEQFMNQEGGLKLSFPVIEALGNGLLPNSRTQGSFTAARTVFEDTRLEHLEAKLRHYDRLLVVSNWNKRLLEAECSKPVELILEGVDHASFFPGPRTGLLDPGRFYVFSGGKIEFRKAQDLVIQAFAVFARRHPDAVLVTAWQSPFGKHSQGYRGVLEHPLRAARKGTLLDIQRWATENGIPAAQVLDIGLVPNQSMPMILREMDCALQISRAEGGTNLPAKEAMACGVPVILARNTGMHDLIGHENCLPLEHQASVPQELAGCGTEGWGESAVDEIVEALERLYSDTALRRRIGMTGAAWIVDEQRTWRDHAEKLKQVILAHA